MPGIHDADALRPFCGHMWKTSQLVGFVIGAFSLAICCLGVPFYGMLITSYDKANQMLGITLLCVSFWVFEVIPPFVTALIPLALGPLLMITSAEVLIRNYWNHVSVLFLGVFIVDAAIQRVDLPRKVTLVVLLRCKAVQPTAILAIFMLTTWVFSMFSNSIAAALLMCPFAVSLMNSAEESEASSEESDDSLPDGARQVQMMSEAILLGIAYAASCGGVATLIGNPNNLVLAGQHILLGHVSFSDWFLYAAPASFAAVLLAFGVLFVKYTRKSQLRIDATIIQEEYDRLVKEGGKVSRDDILVGLIQILLVLALLLCPIINHHVGLTVNGDRLVDASSLCILFALLLFLLPSQTQPGRALLTWKEAQESVPWGTLLLIGGACGMSAGFVQSGLDEVIGGCFAQVFENTHPHITHMCIIILTVIIAHAVPNVAAAAIIMPVLACNARLSMRNPLDLMLPAGLASSFIFMLPTGAPSNVIALGKSRDLFKHLSASQFMAAGVPLTFLVIIATAVLSFIMGSAIFDVEGPYPDWACLNRDSNCLWAYVPGEVRGKQVYMQACMYMDVVNDMQCRLYNGTVLLTANIPSGPTPQ